MNDDWMVGQEWTEGIRQVRFQPTVQGSTYVLAEATWDGQVRVFQIDPARMRAEVVAVPVRSDTPVTSIAWGGDQGEWLFCGDAAGQVTVIDAAGGGSVAGRFSAGSKAVLGLSYDRASGLLAAGGLDAQVALWSVRSKSLAQTLPMPERVYALDASDGVLVVACAERRLKVLQLQGQHQVAEMMSPLQFQSRCVRMLPGGASYLLGSVEGRLALQPLPGMNGQARAWQCHKDDASHAAYTVQDISLCAGLNDVCATVGSNGSVAWWKPLSRGLVREDRPVGAPLVSSSMSSDGRILAIASSHDWSNLQPTANPARPPQLALRRVPSL